MGIAGAGGIGGGAIAGGGGMTGGGNADIPGVFAGVWLGDPGPPERLGGLTEMICVYGLGPLGTAGSLRMGALAEGVEKAPVAPSGADATGVAAGGFGATGMGGGNVENTGAAGATGGAAILGSLIGADGVDGASLMARGSPTGGGGAAGAGFCERISESPNTPVNPELDG